MTGGSRLKIAVIVILVIALTPIVFMVLGGPGRVEEWALDNPDSGVAEWSVRKLTIYYLITLNPRKRVDIFEQYLDIFGEDAAAYEPDTYKAMYWKYAWVGSEYYARGAAGRGFYGFAETFPDDERAEEAVELAKQYGFQPSQ
jgi:hypothetical protein